MPKWTIKCCCAFPRNSAIDLELDTPLFRWSAATQLIRALKHSTIPNDELVPVGFPALAAYVLVDDYTTCHPAVRPDCTGSAAVCPGTSTGSTAIPIATTATDEDRRSSSCNDASDNVRCFRRAKEIYHRLRCEIARQQISYPVSTERSRARLGQST